jgi:hypothetical protein
MYRVLHLEVLDFAMVVWIILMNNGNGSAVTGRIDSPQAGVKLDYIYSVLQLQELNWFMFVEVEDGQQIVSFTGQKGTVMLWVKRHSVIPLAAPD